MDRKPDTDRLVLAPESATPDARTALADEQCGLYRKYDVRRLGGTPGKHDDCTYYVLDLVHDEFAAAALRAYADACCAVYPGLAADLRMLARPAAAAPVAFDPLRPSDVGRLAEALCRAQDRCDGTCPNFGGVIEAHGKHAVEIARQYAALAAAPSEPERIKP